MDTNSNLDNSTANLLFLLAAAPLGMGCIIVSDDGTTSTTAADTGTATSGEQTTSATTTSASATASGTGEGSGGSGDTAGSTGVADSTGNADSTGGVAGDCAGYGANAIECMLPYADYVEDACNYNLAYQEMYSADCGTAYAAFISCLSALSCVELMGDAPCGTELDALLALGCPAVE